MITENAVSPTHEQIAAFRQRDNGKPVHMVNLLKFRDKAVYADGRATDLTGRQAYNIYGMAVMQMIQGMGGQMFFAGKVKGMLIGQVDDVWDQVAIAVYPSTKAMLAMFDSPDYHAIHVHRDAGLKGQLLIETEKLFG